MENNSQFDNNFESESEQLNKYLAFNIGDEIYGIFVKNINEIIGMRSFTALPNVPKFIKGLINLRGNVFPLIELRERIGLQKIPYTSKTCIIIVSFNQYSVGLIVDNVLEVVDIDIKKSIPPPQTYKGTQSKYIQSISKIDNDEVIILLDIEKLLISQ
ncbi:MAG TPA: chemotaxis protein CheW [Bacteroidota bacterium]|nr:chemotaxis protein CheW [Candidatus Kapabacteria bacterium]HRS01716.1 chemotaxis protein CheW [Bacteroidota bacterium]